MILAKEKFLNMDKEEILNLKNTILKGLPVQRLISMILILKNNYKRRNIKEDSIKSKILIK